MACVNILIVSKLACITVGLSYIVFIKTKLLSLEYRASRNYNCEVLRNLVNNFAAAIVHIKRKNLI